MNFSELARTFDQIAEANGRAEKQQRLSELLGSLDEETLEAVANLASGRLVAPTEKNRLGVGSAIIREVLSQISDVKLDEIRDRASDEGDLSRVVAQLAAGSDELTVLDLWTRVERTVQHHGDRRALIEYVFGHTSPEGAKYFTRLATGHLRIGIGEGLVVDAIAESFGVDEESVKRLVALTNDVGLAAKRARRGPRSLAQTRLSLFRPYQFMNAYRVEDLDRVWKKIEGPVLYETKYDGARLQIHVEDDDPVEVRVFSRKLNDVTESLPDVVENLQNCWNDGDAIIEGEAVAFDSSLTTKQPFRMVLSRLGREHDIKEKADEIPLVVYLFDLLYHEGHDLMDTSQMDRRDLLRSSFRSTKRVMITASLVSNDRDEVGAFLDQAVADGHEGLMAKNPSAPYQPGRRNYSWMKLKPEPESLDVVVVGAVWGSGARKGLLSSLVIAVREGDDLFEIGKVGTGFSIEMLESLTEKLEPRITDSRGRHVDLEPSAIIEVDFKSIQQTDTYDSGFALRIPRFKRERTDKGLRDADTLSRVKKLFKDQ